MTEAFIGLGSNLGERVENLATALRMLGEYGVKVLVVSGAYESEPWGVADQPTFANAVAQVRTELPADRLLDVLQQVEDDMGRERVQRYGPRVIDLDLLLYGDEEWESERLTIPHPRMGEREFVVKPLMEIAPAARYPHGKRIAEEHPTEGRIIGELGEVPGFGRVRRHGGSAECGGGSGCGGGCGSAAGPMPEERWVPVMQRTESLLESTMLDFTFAAAVLEDAGIPLCYDPVAPEQRFEYPNFTARTFSIMVPESYADDARKLLAEVQEAHVDAEDSGEWMAGGESEGMTGAEEPEGLPQGYSSPIRKSGGCLMSLMLIVFAGLIVSAYGMSRVPALASVFGYG